MEDRCGAVKVEHLGNGVTRTTDSYGGVTVSGNTPPHEMWERAERENRYWDELENRLGGDRDEMLRQAIGELNRRIEELESSVAKAMEDRGLDLNLRCVTGVEFARLTGFSERTIKSWKGLRVDPLPTVLGKIPLKEGREWMVRRGINVSTQRRKGAEAQRRAA